MQSNLCGNPFDSRVDKQFQIRIFKYFLIAWEIGRKLKVGNGEVGNKILKCRVEKIVKNKGEERCNKVKKLAQVFYFSEFNFFLKLAFLSFKNLITKIQMIDF